MVHGTFNSSEVFNYLINRIQKKVGKKTAKGKKKQNRGHRQRQMFQISNFNVPSFVSMVQISGKNSNPLWNV